MGMIESEWLTCGSRNQMRGVIKNRPFPAVRWVRFNLACTDRIHHLLDDERCLFYMRKLYECVVDMDRSSLPSFQREEINVREALRELWRQRSDPLRDAKVAGVRAILAVPQHTLETSEMVAVAVRRRDCQTSIPSWTAYQDETRAHCRLLRDIFGNPFRPVAFDPE